MARAPRHEEPGAIYHVGTRGSSGQAIFGDDLDRLEFLRRLERTAARYRWSCLAYCLMTNHFHLVVRIHDCGLASGMRELISGYSRQTNRRYGRSDHLFRQHYFSMHIERDEHLLEACRYVVLNPVRARLCASPADWPWSSYRACAGVAFTPRFLASDELLSLFGRTPTVARGYYREFVAAAAPVVSDVVTEA
jgi:putative transposase